MKTHCLLAVSTQHPVHTRCAVSNAVAALPAQSSHPGPWQEIPFFELCLISAALRCHFGDFKGAGFKEQPINGASDIEIFCECCSLGFTFILTSEYLCLGKAPVLEVLLWDHSSA